MWAITHRYKFGFEKKNSGKESQYMVSHPELGSDPPIRSERESGCDKTDLVIEATIETCIGEVGFTL